MKEDVHGRAFIGPHSYEKIFELSSKDGKLLNSKDTSGSYIGFLISHNKGYVDARTGAQRLREYEKCV